MYIYIYIYVYIYIYIYIYIYVYIYIYICIYIYIYTYIYIYIYIYDCYLSVPRVDCPCGSRDLKGRACLAAHSLFSIFMQFKSHPQRSKHFPFIDLGIQRRTNTWSLKQRVRSAQWKQAFPGLPSLVKMRVGRGNI